MSHEIVIIFVRTDPKPHDEIAVLLCDRAIMIADSHRPDVSDKGLEMQRWMERVTKPQLKLFPGETLDVRR